MGVEFCLWDRDRGGERDTEGEKDRVETDREEKREKEAERRGGGGEEKETICRYEHSRRWAIPQIPRNDSTLIHKNIYSCFWVWWWWTFYEKQYKFTIREENGKLYQQGGRKRNDAVF